MHNFGQSGFIAGYLARKLINNIVARDAAWFLCTCQCRRKHLMDNFGNTANRMAFANSY